MIILTKENLRWESAVSTSHVLFLSFFVCVNLCVCNHCCSAAYSLVMMWKAHWTEHIVWIKAPKHVSVTVAEVNSEYVMQAFPCPDKHVSSLTPERVTSVDACWCRLTLHLSSLDNSVSCCSGDVLSSTQLWMRVEQCNQNYSCENHEIVLFDFSAQVVQVVIWLLVKWQWGVGALGFARSDMSGLIEAVSRSA